MTHSVRVVVNMTKQMQAQLDFLNNKLLKKEKRLLRNKKFFGRLGFRWTITRQRNGIIKIKKDLKTIKIQIVQMQKDDKIFTIIDV